ncbi:hypothetical protein GVAV_003546 [Gurleya vavrai]
MNLNFLNKVYIIENGNEIDKKYDLLIFLRNTSFDSFDMIQLKYNDDILYSGKIYIAIICNILNEFVSNKKIDFLFNILIYSFRTFLLMFTFYKMYKQTLIGKLLNILIFIYSYFLSGGFYNNFTDDNYIADNWFAVAKEKGRQYNYEHLIYLFFILIFGRSFGNLINKKNVNKKKYVIYFLYVMIIFLGMYWVIFYKNTDYRLFDTKIFKKLRIK